jgi:hypothetical protein
LMPCLAQRMAYVSSVLMRGFSMNLLGKGVLQVGHVFLPCASQRLKHARQKLCWHGPCRVHGPQCVARVAGGARAGESAQVHMVLVQTKMSSKGKQIHCTLCTCVVVVAVLANEI